MTTGVSCCIGTFFCNSYTTVVIDCIHARKNQYYAQVRFICCPVTNITLENNMEVAHEHEQSDNVVLKHIQQKNYIIGCH